jgi:acyl-CoA thioesterase I
MKKILLSPPVVIATAIVAIAVAWKFWPGGIGNVKNLDSRGANVIAFGDSLTAGYGAGEGEDYPTRLSQSIGTSIINAGVSGDTTETALGRLENDVLSQNPKIVIVGLGGNDYLRRVPFQTTEANLRSIVRQIQSTGAMVVLLGFDFPGFGPDYDEMYEKVADEEGCLLVDDVLDGILNDRNLKSDEIHPNGAGYALIAERVGERMKKVHPSP